MVCASLFLFLSPVVLNRYCLNVSLSMVLSFSPAVYFVPTLHFSSFFCWWAFLKHRSSSCPKLRLTYSSHCYQEWRSNGTQITSSNVNKKGRNKYFSNHSGSRRDCVYHWLHHNVQHDEQTPDPSSPPRNSLFCFQASSSVLHGALFLCLY